MEKVPSSILIKRKRDDDPVESLFVQQDPKRRVTEANFFYKRVISEASKAQSTADAKDGLVNDVTRSVSVTKPRRFYLSRRPSSSGNGLEEQDLVLKNKKRRRDELAVFVAEANTRADVEMTDEAEESKPKKVKPVEVLKKPIAKATKARTQRTHQITYGQDNEKSAAQQQNHKVEAPYSKDVPPEIKELLEEVYREEDLNTVVDSSTISKSPQLPPAHILSKSPMNRKPRIPARRVKDSNPQKELAKELEAMDLDNAAQEQLNSSDDDSYVYDTYIRAPILSSFPKKSIPVGETPIPIPTNIPRANLPSTNSTQPAGSTSTTAPSPSAIRSSAKLDRTIGYIIIPSRTDPDWQPYLSDDGADSSDEAYASDEEDSNAEDWHGADYPEDELSSGDERGEVDYHSAQWDRSEDEGEYSDGEKHQRGVSDGFGTGMEAEGRVWIPRDSVKWR
jgi:hypothetical protein